MDERMDGWRRGHVRCRSEAWNGTAKRKRETPASVFLLRS